MVDTSPPSGPRTGWRQRRWLLAVIPPLLLAAAYAVATIDIRSHDGRVLRSVNLGEIDVGGMTADELESQLDRISSFIETAPVYIETPDAAYQIEAEQLGLTLDRTATRASVLAAGRGGSSVTRPFEWLGALFSPREIDPVLRLDPAAAEAGLLAVSRTISVQPGAPTLLLRNGRLELEPGSPGSILDVSRLLRDLSTSLPSQPGDAITVNAFTTADAMIDVDIQAVVDEVNGATTRPIELGLGEITITVQPHEFRNWVVLDLDGSQPFARLDGDRMAEWLNAAAGIAASEIDTRSLVVQDSQIRLPERNSIRCCDAEAPTMVLDAVLGGARRVDVALLRDDISPLVELGISELIGEFTTEHPSGESRVANIQRMADIARGALIEPGEVFSLNDYVGPRTIDNGFVEAGVIYDGVFTEDVGGGVSQFATTMFNAAFFGGLDIVEYQSHSIYIDRYPYGREATISYPNIDLKVRNPTEFPVLLWTEYTADSITVKLFGTATVTGAQTDQTEEPIDQCTRVRTERTRTWFDGRTETDIVGAVYQPREGIGCDGEPTIPPPECSDDEGLVDTDGNGFGDLCVPLVAICPEGAAAIDEDGNRTIDYCECPTGTEPVDLDGDQRLDRCAPATEPTAEGA